MRRFASCLLICLLLASTVQGDQVLGDLETTAGHVSGEATLGGELVFHERLGTEWSESFFAIDAPALRVETDRAEGTIAVDPLAGTRLRPPTTSVDDFSQGGRVESKAAGEFVRWMLFPQAAGSAVVSMDGSCVDARPSRSDVVERTAFVNWDRDPMVFQLGETMTLAACASSELVIEGDFIVVVWDVPIAVESQGQQTQYWSGDRPSDRNPVPGSGPAVVVDEQEIFLFVTEGTLRTPLLAEDRVHVASAAGAVQGTVVLDEAAGGIHVGERTLSLNTEPLVASGTIDMSFESKGEHLIATLGGDIDRMSIGGEVVPLTGPSALSSLAWSLLLLVPLVVAAAYWSRPWSAYRQTLAEGMPPNVTRPRNLRERIALGWHMLSRRSLGKGRFAAARRLCARAARAAPNIPDHHWLRGVLNKDESQYKRALKAYERLDRQLRRPRERARNAWSAANVCRELGDAPQALEWVRRAERADPSFAGGPRRGPGDPSFA